MMEGALSPRDKGQMNGKKVLRAMGGRGRRVETTSGIVLRVLEDLQ